MKSSLKVGAAVVGICIITGVTCGPAFLAGSLVSFFWQMKKRPDSAPAKMAEWMKNQRQQEWNEMKKNRGIG